MFQPVHFGKYYLYERLAVGGMAEIYKAKLYGVDGFEKNMVVKQILTQYARHEEFVQMFVDEAKICVSLSHGNIVPVYELGQIEDIYFIAMDWVDGKNLGELLDAGLDREMPLSVPHALYITSEILAGLDYAHRKTDEHGEALHIVHRDVSPQNVIISFEGEVKIVDFGIARAATKAHATEAGVIKGKFGYMSPEQAQGKEVDGRSDVFATGILLYEMLTLERLFHSDSSVFTLERVKRADIPTPSRTNPKLPPQLDAIVFKALERNSRKRYQSAGEMRKDINKFLFQLEQEASANTVTTYMQGLFSEELVKRKRQGPLPRPLPPAAAVPVAAQAPVDAPSPPASGPAVTAPAGPQDLFGASSVASSAVDIGELETMEESRLDMGVAEEPLDLDFTYGGAAKRAKWLVISLVLAALVLGYVFLRAPISSMFSTMGRVVDESSARLAQKDLGTILVRSQPSGAAVYFGNRKIGSTNMRIRKIDPEIEYELVLTMEGYPPWARKILPSDWRQNKKMEIQIFKDWAADSLH